jgi:hypothetical protein
MTFYELSSTARCIYLLKRDIFEVTISFLNFIFFFIILIVLDGSISAFFFFVNLMRVIVIFISLFPGLKYTLKFLSHFSLLELSETCILFISIRIMRRLALISFPVWTASATKILFLIVFSSAGYTLIIIVLS